jgi:hypothetical protein
MFKAEDRSQITDNTILNKMVKSMIGIHIARIFKSQKVIMSYGVSFVMVPNDGHKMLTIYLK